MVTENFAYIIMALCFGLCIGSFLNVCIYRIPNSLSIIKPPSYCPNCKKSIPFYFNIPVFGYLILLGKCYFCKIHIPIRYPIIELLSGLFAACVVVKFGFNLTALIYYIFITVLITITFIDIDHMIIPDKISLPGIIIFFIASFGLPTITILDSALGFALGGGFLGLISLSYYLITKKEGMGGGDIKLLAMIGTLIGVKGVIFTIFVSSAVGTLAGVIIMITQKKNADMKIRIPFGPFLAIGAIAYVFFGTEVIDWYMKLMLIR